MFCPKCARKNPDKNKFCNGCGTSLRVAAFPPANPISVPPPPPPPPVKQTRESIRQPSAEENRGSNAYRFEPLPRAEGGLGSYTPESTTTEHREVSTALVSDESPIEKPSLELSLFTDTIGEKSDDPQPGVFQHENIPLSPEIERPIGEQSADHEQGSDVKVESGDFGPGPIAEPASDDFEFEEATSRLDELLPTDSNLSAQESERHARTFPTSATAKPVSNIQNSPHYVQTQRRSGKTKLVIVTISALLILILLGAVVALRWSSNPPNTSATTSEPTKPTATETPPGMAYVPGGEFNMGGDTQEFNGRKFTSPPQKVSVKPFFMDVYEVTCDAYKLFLDATNYGPPKGWKGKSYPPGAAKLPVTNVNWDAANAYAKWAGKRLPTETEWEFAARGTDGRLYSWGPDWKDGMANANKVKNGMVEVGTYKGASPFNIYDLIGNACEWTSTTLEPYPGGTMPVVDPKLEYKMIRGGTWESGTTAATATRRGFYGARDESSYENTSFRCVKDMTEK